MDVKGFSIRNVVKRTGGRNNGLLYVLPAAIIIFGVTGQIARASYPIVRLDVSNRNLASQTEPGYTSFTVTDNGMDVISRFPYDNRLLR